MNPDKIDIKGIRQGILVTLGEGDWNNKLYALEARISANPAFFRDGRVALDIGARELGRAQIARAQTLLARHRVDLWALISTNPTTKTASQELGLVTELISPAPREPEVVPEQSEESSEDEGLVVQRTLRSGQSLRHPGHIVVIGDVNPGAQVVAGGNIVVWGRVRGVVHAGAQGNDKAVICSLDLAPTQLRIAGYIARSPEERGRNPVPEMALVRDEQIVAEPWQGD
jgi:septum site-determining protein MinC